MRYTIEIVRCVEGSNVVETLLLLATGNEQEYRSGVAKLEDSFKTMGTYLQTIVKNNDDFEHTFIHFTNFVK